MTIEHPGSGAAGHAPPPRRPSPPVPLAMANLILVLAATGVGLNATPRFAKLLRDFNARNAQKIVDAAVADIGRQVAQNQALRKPMADRDASAMAAALDEEFGRGATSSGQIKALAFEITDPELRTLGRSGRGARLHRAELTLNDPAGNALAGLVVRTDASSLEAELASAALSSLAILPAVCGGVATASVILVAGHLRRTRRREEAAAARRVADLQRLAASFESGVGGIVQDVLTQSRTASINAEQLTEAARAAIRNATSASAAATSSGQNIETVAAAAEEQQAATREIAASVARADAAGVGGDIDSVTRAVQDTGAVVDTMTTVARELAAHWQSLRIEVDRFLVTVRAA